MDFQTFDNSKFENGNRFSIAFASSFLKSFERNKLVKSEKLQNEMDELTISIRERNGEFALMDLFEQLSAICAASNKPIVLLIDEVDSAANNQVFLDFLAQLRAYYIDRDVQATFQSVILAGVYDIKNLKRKLRPEDAHKLNSPWNIAADFNVDMSFSKDEIEQMLKEYDADYQLGMDTDEMAGLIFDYTGGYPFLVSRLCKLMDEEVSVLRGEKTKKSVWTKDGFYEALRMILLEKNALFESLVGKLTSYPELNEMLQALLFTGRNIPYNPDEASIDNATMFGFIKNQHGVVAIANRIFETRLYNLYLSSAEMQRKEIYKESLQDKNQFVINGYLNMQLLLEKFVLHFHDLYGDENESFLEEEGRKYFLLYLRPIINGTGNYYIESRTRELRRTDVVVDYHGVQYVIEMKIWRGEEYNRRGEEQLAGYLDDYKVNTGYMVSFNFNKKKTSGIREIVIGEKKIIEAIV
jgi:hypothetical protein